MDAEYANYYTREVMLILIREFQSPDEEMKKIVLKVLVPDCSIFTNLNWMCFIVEREFYIIKKLSRGNKSHGIIYPLKIVKKAIHFLRKEGLPKRKQSFDYLAFSS